MMRIDIWSDVVCPFCYIGKRRLEAAVRQLPSPSAIDIRWRSFQLLPHLRTDPPRNAIQAMSERKGWPIELARQAAAELTALARADGLRFDYERTVVANTFDAHRLTHFADTRGQGDEMVEQLFKAFFSDGRNIADPATLEALATGIGLPAADVRDVVASNAHEEDVRNDIDAAFQLGLGGVPFFVIDGRFAITGAQDSSIFMQALTRALGESRLPDAVAPDDNAAPVCDPGEGCS